MSSKISERILDKIYGILIEMNKRLKEIEKSVKKEKKKVLNG
tara:strand:- start:564 stop:689 length:126 start_codon:yes stop_codon:yes gene_type:complete